LPHSFIQYLASDGACQGLNRPRGKTIGKIKHKRKQRYEERYFSSGDGNGGCRRAVGIAGIGAEEIRHGATDTEIKIGQTVPFSGPASAYAIIGKTQAAYIRMITTRAA